jgi:hypothetical protein
MITKEERTKLFIELLKGYAQNQSHKQKQSTYNKKYYQLHKEKILLKNKIEKEDRRRATN